MLVKLAEFKENKVLKNLLIFLSTLRARIKFWGLSLSMRLQKQKQTKKQQHILSVLPRME